MNETLQIVKANGEREPFNRKKLESSLRKAGAHEQEVLDVVAHIEAELSDGMTTGEIYRHAFKILGKKDRPVAARYSMRRALMELGPAGFAFEDFLAEIFKKKGYSTLTDQQVMGGCVPHEVDVIAWNEEQLIMTEAKFHNRLGTKTDLKAALYVKARFDDIKEAKHNYGRLRPLDQGMLITNTKFTSTAIHYGECKKLMLVGWNYPADGNLQDTIEETGLHPLTCLTSLTKHQKGILLNNNIVLCKTIQDNPDILKTAGINNNKKIDDVLSETQLLCR